jgi:CubicO group peptidase (beta-lactamase class C family)
MVRRDSLIESSLAAVGLTMQNAGGPRDTFLDSLVEGWAAGIPKWLQESKLPAASIAIVRDGGLTWRRAFGVKDTGTNEPVDDDSVFAACSNTKPVFACRPEAG